MALLADKNSTEKKQIIAAAVLGLVALIALYMAFGRSFFGGSSTTTSSKSTPTPRPATTNSTTGDRAMPSADEQRFHYETTPIDYRPGNAYAPDAGRNIFAFYEPPPPCKGAECPTPTPKPMTPLPTPTPPPPPPINLRAAIPQNVYAGQKAFRLEVDGTPFPTDARIYFNQTEMPTTFVSPQRLSTEIPANLIAQEGPRMIIVQTPDGKVYSNPVSLSVNPPPKPTVQYIGMIGRKRYNNDTAYLTSGSGTTPFGARLNDVVGGQFRLIDITPSEVIFEDVNLGFRHRVAITKAPTGVATSPGAPIQGDIPGIPSNIPRYVPPNQQRPPVRPGEKKDDVDDKDDPPR